MRIAIRMIGIATTCFWIFLIAFFGSAAYSAKDFQFDFGDPQISLNPQNEILVSVPVSIANHGLYDVSHFRIASRVSDVLGDEIARGSTFVPLIRKSEEITTHHNATISLDEMLQRTNDYLFNDSELDLHLAVGLNLAQLIPVEAQDNWTIPWGAPLYNFALGQPQYSPHNATHFRVLVPVNFENHASFDLIGDVALNMFNNNDLFIGDGQIDFGTTRNSYFNGLLEMYVLTSGVTARGRFEIHVFSPLFNYGPWVVPYG